KVLVGMNIRKAHARDTRIKWLGWLAAIIAAAAALSGCAGPSEEGGAGTGAPGKGDVTLVVGAYSVAKDAMAELLPMFQRQWLAETGQKVAFQESYEASGTQARSIVGGFEADVAILAMETDFD